MKIFKTIKEKILYEKDEIITGIVFFIVLGAICAWIVSCEIKSGKIINPKTFIIYNIEDLKRKAKLNLKNQRIRIMERMEIYYSDLSKEAQIEFDSTFGEPEGFNHEVSPLFVFEAEGADAKRERED